MNRRTKVAIAGVAAVAVIGGGAAVAVASGEEDAPIPPTARDQAVLAALHYVGGGTVTETEIGDGGAAYSVEVRLPDGRQVEVALDERFRVIGTESDDDGVADGSGDEAGGEDD
jgi:uncharacterized membrane protein YkoI